MYYFDVRWQHWWLCIFQAHKILKTLQKYIRAEEKDRTHTVNHFKHLKRTDPETAEKLQPSVQVGGATMSFSHNWIHAAIFMSEEL